MNTLVLSISSIFTFSLAYAAYSNRIKILENCNYYYVNIKTYIEDINPITIVETIKLKSETIYHIKLLDSSFIVKDLNINIDNYKALKKSLIIPHSPEDILNATLTSDDKEVDIMDQAKLLIGPFLDQINEKNEKWIFEYLEKHHNFKNIISLKITLINGKINNLKNRNI